MLSLKKTAHRGILYASVAALVLASSPFVVMADDTAAAPTYDEATGMWNTDKWTYDGASGTYQPTPAPAPAVSQSTPEVPVQTIPEATQQTQATPSGASQSVSSPTGTTVQQQAVSGQQGTQSSTMIGNQLQSQATSGNAAVASNGSAGNATSGNATAQTTIINSVHSTVGGDTAGVAQFTVDIDGDVTGDIVLRPIIDGATHASTKIKSDVTATNNNSITNDVSLSATSGDAAVTHNTAAGSATTGSAHTVADVVNLINSIIAANQSFIGTINIYGNLNGDILVSPEFIPQLLDSNASSQNSLEAELGLLSNSNQSIINNIQLSATSGDANVDHNTAAGSAATGDSQTNLTVLNLTGREVDASNSMLVFVNVLGTWVGMIVDAPNATAAMLGSGVTKNDTTLSSTIAATDNAAITNNIDLVSQSGDASVTGNTMAGNATSGAATASANIANIATSVFKVSDWFGIVFINVFGTWVGSFGVDTESGTLVPLDNTVTAGAVASGAPNLALQFVPSASSQSSAQVSTRWWPTYSPSVRATGSVAELPDPVASQAVELAAAMSTEQPDADAPLESDSPATLGVQSNQTGGPARAMAFTIAIAGMILTVGYMVVRRLW